MGRLRADVLAALTDGCRAQRPVVLRLELDPALPLQQLLAVVSTVAVHDAVTDLRPASLDLSGPDSPR